MKIAVASGKGGTGKTTFAVSLALAINNKPVWLLDCDVEAPNVHIFLSSENKQSKQYSVLIPEINDYLCNGCGLCQKNCEYNAMIILNRKAQVVPDLCHACGACSYVCPAGAIHETKHPIGTIQYDKMNEINVIQGKLNIGSTLSVPIIKAIKKTTPSNAEYVISDCPPGTSCTMIHSVKDADVILLITEPTPFGLHDLQLAVNTLKSFSSAYLGIIINRFDIGGPQVEEYCKKENLPVLFKLPYSNQIARAYAQGIPFTKALPHYQAHFHDLLKKLACKRTNSL